MKRIALVTALFAVAAVASISPKHIQRPVAPLEVPACTKCVGGYQACPIGGVWHIVQCGQPAPHHTCQSDR